MTDFFDWLTTSDSGLAADRLASAYNLSPSELHETTQALAPAFSLALMRAMSNPATATDLSRQFAPFFAKTDATSRMAAERDQVGQLTESLFGSKALVDAISRQVSSVTGTAPDTVRPLMRNLTLMAMQTMMQMVGASYMRGVEKGEFKVEDAPANVADMMRRSANALEAFSRPPNETPRRNETPGMSNMFADAFQGPLPWLPPMPFMASTNAMKPKEEERALSGGDGTSDLPPMPFLAIFDGFARGLAYEPERNAAPDREPAEKPEPAPETEADETEAEMPAIDPAGFGRLMDASAEMQADYLKRMTALFDANPRDDGKRR